jgi:hypothetical protein
VAAGGELICEARDMSRYAARIREVVRGNQSDLDLLILPLLIAYPGGAEFYIKGGLLLRVCNTAELSRGEVILGVHLPARK